MNASTPNHNEQRLDELFAHIAAHDWNGPGTNKRVDRFLLERKHRMNKKQKLTVAGIVALSSLLSAGVAAAVTHQMVTQSFQIRTESGQILEGELITPVNPALPGEQTGTFVTTDGQVHELRMNFQPADEPLPAGDH